jgi:phosphopantothenoylcysteine decarboxylase / phosphopantothenate---cysteine ligase
MRLTRKKILLCVTGSIAAYKACEVLRLLKKEGAEIRVVMTASAQRFVHPLTFETLSGEEVIREMFPAHRTVKTRHIGAAEWADCILVCPATANSIGKMASGIADDFLSTVVLASRSPVLLAPAMDDRMIRHPIFLRNCETLKSIGVRFIDAEEGELASGLVGSGRLAEIPAILDAVRLAVLGTRSLKGVRVLVTAGPTREALDPVRCLTNRSSGKMGFALADEARLRGAEVTLVSGPVALRPPSGIRLVRVETARQMADAVEREWDGHHILVAAAAVADYAPKTAQAQKIKKGSDTLSVELVKTPDVLGEAASRKGNRLAVGFALETEDGENRAMEKLERKGLDLICLNSPFDSGSGFDADATRLTLMGRNGEKTELPLLPKWEAARGIFDEIERLRNEGRKP